MTIALVVGIGEMTVQAAELRTAIASDNPRTFEGAEAIVTKVHEHLFRPDQRGIGATKVRCQGALASTQGIASKLPLRVQVVRAEALAECNFINQKWEMAAAELAGLLKLCKRDVCPRLLDRIYDLARGWMWLEPARDVLRREEKRVSGLKSENGRYIARLKVALEKSSSLLRAIEQAEPSLEKRKGRVGFFVEKVHSDGGADAAGLLPGDIILSIGGKAVKHIQDYRQAATSVGRIARAQGGRKSPHSIFFLRGGLGHERTLRSLPIRADVIALRKSSPYNH